MTVAAIYARKSTAQGGDSEDRSVARQVANARDFAKSKGWTVSEQHVYVDDGISGTETRKLVAKQRMLNVINSGDAPFSVLVVQAPDRLSRRDGDESFNELKRIEQAGVATWFYADGQQFKYGTFESNVMGVLRGEVGAEFRREIAKKTREALSRKFEHGFVVGGRVFGYDNVRTGGHTERRISETEAAVVRRIYERYAAGEGLPTIAHGLNSDAAPCPRPQQGRLTGWSPSSIREVLKRPIYRGELVWGKTKKRDKGGEKNPTKRDQAEWKRIPAPGLRIVSEKLASAVDARFESMRARTLRLTKSGRLIGRPPGEGSKYLLAGVPICGCCGGTMEVLSAKCGGRRTFTWRCYNARRKGPAHCVNKLGIPLADADSAVLRAISDTLLHPAVVERALMEAEAQLLAGDRTSKREDLLSARTDIDNAIRRLTSAIAKGGELDSLVSALESYERQRQEIETRLSAVREPSPQLDIVTVRQELREYIAEWERLLTGHVGQAQQIIRRLIVGRLTFVPQRDGTYTFTGQGTVKPLLGGVVRKLASPRTLAPDVNAEGIAPVVRIRLTQAA